MLKSLSPDALILGPRPGKKSFKHLDALNLTHCCTLLHQREQPKPVAQIAERLGCEWVWLPIHGGRLDVLRAVDWARHLKSLEAALSDVESPRVYLHCSAGIHRTGVFAYMLLRLGGRDPEAARQALADLRPVTADQVGADRLELAEELLQSPPLSVLM